MDHLRHIVALIVLLGSLSSHRCKAQDPGSSTGPARTLDALLQDYAFRAFVHPRTGVPYDGTVPSNLSGIKIASMRLRTGSLRKRGVRSYKEFSIPVGVVVQPRVERLVIVYQNLGNWSSFYYPLPGYTYLTPVLGLLAYDAVNLSATNKPELDLVASQLPLSINFTDVDPVPNGLTARCVWFGLDGLPEFRELLSTNICSIFRQGHFSIVVNSTGMPPSPAPSEVPGPNPLVGESTRSKVGKIVGAVVGGVLALMLFFLLVVWCLHYRRKKKVTEMERQADASVSLQMTKVGDTKAPVALGTRTQPVLENEYVA